MYVLDPIVRHIDLQSGMNTHVHTYTHTSLIPRPLPVFQCCSHFSACSTEKVGVVWRRGYRHNSLVQGTSLIQLDPVTVWLREDSPGSRAFFPNEHNTCFILNDDVGILSCDLMAMGSPVNVQTPTPPTSSARVLSTPSEPSTSGLSHQTQLSAKKTQSCNVKIVQALVKRLTSRKLEFSPQNQTFVDVTEATANVHYVSSAVQRKWGQEYTLVTSDGLKVDDSSGTKGKICHMYFN